MTNDTTFLPARFKDQNGNEWAIRYTGLEMTRILEKEQINICDARVDPQAFAQSLTMDQIFRMIWHAIEGEATKKQLSYSSWLQGCYGDTLEDMATAFWEALTNFSQPARLRPASGRLIERSKKLLEERQNEEIQRVDAMSDEELAKLLGLTSTENISNSAGT